MLIFLELWYHIIIVVLLVADASSGMEQSCPDSTVAGRSCTSDADCNDALTSDVCAEGFCCASCRKLERQIRRQLVNPAATNGVYVPECTENGRRYLSQQCIYISALNWECWCTTEFGREIANSRMQRNNRLNCPHLVAGHLTGPRISIQHCPDGQIARNIVCTVHADCPPGFECQQSIAQCCQSVRFCPDGNVASGSPRQCTNSADCPVDYYCSLNIRACCPMVIAIQKMCPGDELVPPLDFPPTCTEDSECISGFYCSKSVHACCPRSGMFPECSNGLSAIGLCFEHGICPQGLFCENGHCCPHECTYGPALKLPGTNQGIQCNSNRSCPANFSCRSNDRIPGIHISRPGHCCPAAPPQIETTTTYSSSEELEEILCPDGNGYKEFCDEHGLCDAGYSCVTTPSAVNICCKSELVKGIDQCPESLVPLKENGESKQCDAETNNTCPLDYICNFSIGTSRYICCGQRSNMDECRFGTPLYLSAELHPKPCNSTSPCPRSHTCSNGVCCPTRRTVCTRPKRVGNCGTYSEKYWFNPATRRCETFVYSGCGGNDNRFDTNAECRSTCQNI